MRRLPLLFLVILASETKGCADGNGAERAREREIGRREKKLARR